MSLQHLLFVWSSPPGVPAGTSSMEVPGDGHEINSCVQILSVVLSVMITIFAALCLMPLT